MGGKIDVKCLALALGLPVTMLVVAATRPSADVSGNKETNSLVERALDRASWVDEQNFESRYRCTMTRHVRHFHSDGRLKHEDLGEFEVEPIEGVPFARRISIDGRPLSEEEQTWEREREAAFRDELHNAEDPTEDDNDIVFNVELVSRYEFRLEGEESLRGRPSYRLSFAPSERKQPVRRQIDHALNKARGSLWIDRATLDVARVEFELIEKVRLWWGLIGTISHARGSLDRFSIAENIWVPLQLETFSDSRVLFSRTRRAELSQWRDFELIAD